MAYRVVPDRQGVINIGKLKENLVTEVELPAPGFEGGSYAVLLQRPREKEPYPVTARTEGNALIWTVQTADTAIPGTGKLECRWYGDNGEVAKSQIYMVRITDGLSDPTEAPEAWEGFMGQVARNAQAAKTAAGEAKANADGAAASAGIAQGAAADAGKLAGAAGDAANAAASAASAASSAQAGAETAGQNARAAAEAAETAKSGAEAAKLAAAESATGAAGSAEAAAQAAQEGQNLYNQVKDDLAAGKLKGEKGDPGKDAPQIDDGTISRDTPWSSRKIIDTLCPPIADSGNPVTCYPVAGYPLGVVAKWEPTQAGSGEPYPAGGGPQLLDISRCTATVGKPYGLTITIDGDIIKCSGVPSAEVTTKREYGFAVANSGQEELRGKGYKVTAWPIKGKVTNAWGLRTADESSLAIAGELSPGVDTDIQLRLMVSKDTPSSYAPYENIRPISGREAVTVKRCGENLIKYPVAGKRNGIEITVDGSKLIVKGTCQSGTSIKTDAVYLPDGTYTLSSDVLIPAGAYISAYIKVEKLLLNKNTSKATGQLSGNTQMLVYLEAGTYNFTVQISLVPGTTAPTAYAPYRGDTLKLALPETVYGGSVDAVTGDGTENVKIITVDGDKIKFTGTGDCWNLPLHSAPGIGAGSAIWCSHFDSKRFIINTRYSFIFTSPGRMTGLFASAAELSAYCAAQYAAGTPVQIAYKLETPTPITATGAKPIPALAGCNAILTDADSVTVTGRADPAHAIAALQAQLSVATQQLEETQAAMVDTTAMTVDYIYEKDLEDIGLEEVETDDNQTDSEPVDVPGV